MPLGPKHIRSYSLKIYVVWRWFILSSIWWDKSWSNPHLIAISFSLSLLYQGYSSYFDHYFEDCIHVHVQYMFMYIFSIYILNPFYTFPACTCICQIAYLYTIFFLNNEQNNQLLVNRLDGYMYVHVHVAVWMVFLVFSGQSALCLLWM